MVTLNNASDYRLYQVMGYQTIELTDKWTKVRVRGPIINNSLYSPFNSSPKSSI